MTAEPLARHTAGSIHGCNAPLRMRFERNPIRAYGPRVEWLLVVRCGYCSAIIKATPILEGAVAE